MKTWISKYKIICAKVSAKLNARNGFQTPELGSQFSLISSLNV